MSRRRRRKRRSYRGLITGHIASLWATLTENPSRSAVVGVLCLMSLWLVLTKSLPYALAPTRTNAALALNPNNPVALLIKAEERRAKLVALTTIGAEKAKETGDDGA